MREIPSLQSLCLRSVGAPSCSVETTFASDHQGEQQQQQQQQQQPSRASCLLRLYHKRPVVVVAVAAATAVVVEENVPTTATTSTSTTTSSTVSTIHDIPMTRTLCVGKYSSRRANVNDVDLNPRVGIGITLTMRRQERIKKIHFKKSGNQSRDKKKRKKHMQTELSDIRKR